MAKLYSYQTPDARLRHISYQRQREEERSQRLDEEENQRFERVNEQFQVERQRKESLDALDDIGRQRDVEEQRAERLGDLPSSISTRARGFAPSPDPSGRFLDRVSPPRPEISDFPPSPIALRDTVSPLSPEEQEVGRLVERNAIALLNANPSMEPQEAWDQATQQLEPGLINRLAPEPRGGLAGRFERGVPRVAGAVGKGISAVDEAAFQVNKFINEQLGTPPEQQPTREEFGGVLTPRISEGQIETLRKVLPQPIEEPVVREVEVLSTPAGLATMLAWPTFVLKGAVGGIGLAAGARGVGAPEAVEIGAQITGNILTPGAGLVPELSKIAGGLRGTQATAYATRMTEEITTARSAVAALREAGLASKADELERFAEIAEGALARAEGRAVTAAPTGAVIGEGALAPTRADIAALQAVRATTIGDVSAPEFAQQAVRADVPATGELISSQVLQPRPQTGPAILQTQLPEGVADVGQRLAAETGGGLLPGIPERLLPQGGIPGGFQARPKGMKPGAKVTGLSQEGEQVEGTLIQALGEKALIRDAAGNVRPVSAPTLVEEAAGVGIRTRLQDIGRSIRFGPSPRTAVPSLDASVQKFVRVLRTAKPTQRTLKAERAQELAKRAARGRVPFETEALSPQEALKGLRRAQAGKLPEPPEFEVKLPSGEKGLAADAFTQDEVTNFINIARFSPTLDRELFTRGNIIESLMGSVDKKGILFGRLPTPGELKQLERVYGAEFARELQKLRPFGERFWRNTLDTLNIPRTLLAAFDLSFPFRQGVFAFARHPKEFFGNLPAMLRAAKNPEFAEQMIAAIKADRTLIETTEGFRPLNELAEEAKLFLPGISGTEAFEARAEEFLSQLARRVPGVGFAERGFIAYGDKLRSDIFRNTLQSWARQSKPGTADEIADLGMLLNVLTGRGNLPPQLAKALSFGFFAPRFASARPQFFLAATLNNLPGVRRGTGILLGAPGQTSRVAQLATQELVTSVGMGIGILTLAKMSGVADVELNPLSSDFGKMKIGKTRVDFWGGARPWATVIARMIMGKKKTSTGFVVPQDVMDSVLAFGRSKLSPPGAITVDMIVGETAIGEPIGTLSDIMNRTIPLAIQDVKDAVEQEGLSQGLLSISAFLGVGVQTYETPGEKFERVTGEQWEETPSRLRDEFIRKTPELADLPGRLESDATRIRAERSAALLPQARSVLRGVTDAGVEYNNIRKSVMPQSAGAAAEAFRGLNITPKGQDNELLVQYYDVDFQADHNNDGNFGDSDDVKIAIEQQESTKSQMSKPVQGALDNPENFFPNAEVVEVERMRDSATDAIDKILELPKWSGLSLEEGERLDEVVREVRAEVQMQKQQAQQAGIDPDRITFKSVASGMARRDSPRVEELTEAEHVSSGRAIRARERMDLALENRDVLLKFFPNFIASVLPAEVERGELTEEEFRQIIRPPAESAIGVLKR